MPYDIEYNATTTTDVVGPDNIMDTAGNYNRITGSRSKVGRCVAAWYKEIDGVGFGNRAWKELQRELDTVANRAILKRYIEQAIQPLIASGEIAEVEVTVDDAVRLKGLGAQIKFKDVREGDDSTLGVISPWGIAD